MNNEASDVLRSKKDAYADAIADVVEAADAAVGSYEEVMAYASHESATRHKAAMVALKVTVKRLALMRLA